MGGGNAGCTGVITAGVVVPRRGVAGVFLSQRRDDAGCNCGGFDSFDGGCTGFIIGAEDSFHSLARLHAGNFWFLAAGGSHWSYR